MKTCRNSFVGREDESSDHPSIFFIKWGDCRLHLRGLRKVSGREGKKWAVISPSWATTAKTLRRLCCRWAKNWSKGDDSSDAKECNLWWRTTVVRMERKLDRSQENVQMVTELPLLRLQLLILCHNHLTCQFGQPSSCWFILLSSNPSCFCFLWLSSAGSQHSWKDFHLVHNSCFTGSFQGKSLGFP